MKEYIGYNKKAPTAWFTLTVLVVLSLAVFFYLDTLVWAENTYSVCGVQCEALNTVEPYYGTYERGTKEYMRAFCNQMNDTIWQCI